MTGGGFSAAGSTDFDRKSILPCKGDFIMRPIKKLLAIAIALVLPALLLAGCSANEQTQGGAADSGASAAGSFSAGDIALVIDGKTYRCAEDVSSLLKDLGDQYTYSEAISCAYDGLDKTYSYENADVYTYPDGEIDRVSEITVYGGDVSTPKGLKIGDSVARLEELYGAGYEEAGITLVYQLPAKQENAEGASLYVTVEDNAITAIAITAEMLME
jgi:hypothetical protein